MPLSAVLAEAEYTFSPLTVSAWNVDVGTTIEFSARISPVPQIPKDCDVQPAGWCMYITLEIVESESKDWKPVSTISILNDLPLGPGMGHYSSDGSFLMDWTPDSSGKFMARVRLVSGLVSGENILGSQSSKRMD